MPFEYDQVNIVCPVYAPGTHESDAEKYIIYNVSISYMISVKSNKIEGLAATARNVYFSTFFRMSKINFYG